MPVLINKPIPAVAPYVGRFAPSPTGPLHIGSLLTAVASYLDARAHQGQWLVRIEDLDPQRTLNGMDLNILETLALHGMESDQPAQYQSQRTRIYQRALEQIREYCFQCSCSRKTLAAYHGLHPNECPAYADSNGPAIRVRVDPFNVKIYDRLQGYYEQALDQKVGAFVIKRRDAIFAYQLAVVVDDADQKITQIVRGRDLLDCTPRQRWLQSLLKLPRPQYLHLPLVVNSLGQKLSKQAGANNVRKQHPKDNLQLILKLLGIELSQSARKHRSPKQLLLEAVPYWKPDRLPKNQFPGYFS